MVDITPLDPISPDDDIDTEIDGFNTVPIHGNESDYELRDKLYRESNFVRGIAESVGLVKNFNYGQIEKLREGINVAADKVNETITEIQIIDDNVVAIGQSVSSLNVRVDDVETGLTNKAEISYVESVEASANEALASVTLNLDVNDYIIGYEIKNDGTTGSFDIIADNFRVINPDNTTQFLEYSSQEERLLVNQVKATDGIFETVNIVDADIVNFTATDGTIDNISAIDILISGNSRYTGETDIILTIANSGGDFDSLDSAIDFAMTLITAGATTITLEGLDFDSVTTLELADLDYSRIRLAGTFNFIGSLNKPFIFSNCISTPILDCVFNVDMDVLNGFEVEGSRIIIGRFTYNHDVDSLEMFSTWTDCEVVSTASTRSNDSGRLEIDFFSGGQVFSTLWIDGGSWHLNDVTFRTHLNVRFLKGNYNLGELRTNNSAPTIVEILIDFGSTVQAAVNPNTRPRVVGFGKLICDLTVAFPNFLGIIISNSNDLGDISASFPLEIYVQGNQVATLPVGITYVQFPSQPAPATLFGGTWERMFSNEGAFFRTEGGEASSFEAGLQGDQTKRITGGIGGFFTQTSGPHFADGAINWSTFATNTGGGGSTQRRVNFYINSANSPNSNASSSTAHETRPRNRTIRVWRKIS